jgi:hypothetical protein
MQQTLSSILANSRGWSHLGPFGRHLDSNERKCPHGNRSTYPTANDLEYMCIEQIVSKDELCRSRDVAHVDVDEQ